MQKVQLNSSKINTYSCQGYMCVLVPEIVSLLKAFSVESNLGLKTTLLYSSQSNDRTFTGKPQTLNQTQLSFPKFSCFLRNS